MMCAINWCDHANRKARRQATYAFSAMLVVFIDAQLALFALMIAFITGNSNSVSLLQGLCSSNPCTFEFSIL